MNLISYNTWKKHHTGCLLAEGYRCCGDDYYLKSIYPKDLAMFIIHKVFIENEHSSLNEQDLDKYEFVYVPKYHKRTSNKLDTLEIWYKEI